MEHFIINEQALENGAYEIHNATQGSVCLPEIGKQIMIGYFASYDLAYKRARMNWPKEKVQACAKCCLADV